jgi:exodeoxyribonuclease-5
MLLQPTPTGHQLGVINQVADWYEEVCDWDFDEHHWNADGVKVKELSAGQDFKLGGFAGTGKSTILPTIIEKIKLNLEDVAFCAPTGKAAKVMGEKLRAFGIYSVPTTIHKLIYIPRAARVEAIDRNIARLNANMRIAEEANAEMVYNLAGEKVSRGELTRDLNALQTQLARALEDDDGPSFTLRHMDEFPERIKLVIVDEASMVGTAVADDLASFGRPILAMGDPGQLPPVKDEAGFDMQKADAFLTEIHRQAADNPIIHLSVLARQGEELPVGDYGDGVRVIKRQNDDVTYDVDYDSMIIVGTHKKRWMVTSKIREALRLEDSGPAADEPLMICKNSRSNPGLVNGTIVRNVNDFGDLQRGNSVMTLDVFDDEADKPYRLTCAQPLFEEHLFRKRNAYSSSPRDAFNAKRNHHHIDWAHCITCHKAQGSQWDDVVVHDESGVFRDAASKWLYTAVTRAAERLTVVV